MTEAPEDRYRRPQDVIETDQPPMVETRGLTRDYEMPAGVARRAT
jgi:hypothetical protein